jgi:choline dehydrogenase-like flavoprotein
LATKINFDNNKRAVSVTILKSGKVFTVKAQKEIILSAGAINSAKLLMLSGIGPKDHLKELNIPLVVDLPVGHNFHDQPMTFGVHFTINETQKSNELLQKDITEFFLNGTGVLAQFEKAVLRTSTKYETNKSWPDIQVFANPGSFADFQTAESAENALNIKQNIWQKFYKPYSGQSTISFVSLLSRPQSRGRIKLKSNNIRDDPIIDPNYFSNSIDLKTLVEGMKLGYILGQTKAFVDTFRAKPFRTQVPNCPSISFNSYSSFSLPSYSSFYPSSASSSSSSYSYSSSYFYSSSYSFSSSSSSYSSHSSSSSAPFIPSDEYLECVAKTLTNTFNHAAGTARMGSKNDKKAVVSSELKVHGIHGLRVIDASVCPQATSGGLYATVLAIAEKGVHYILNDLHKY